MSLYLSLLFQFDSQVTGYSSTCIFLRFLLNIDISYILPEVAKWIANILAIYKKIITIVIYTFTNSKHIQTKYNNISHFNSYVTVTVVTLQFIYFGVSYETVNICYHFLSHFMWLCLFASTFSKTLQIHKF